jgi:hypothetical protein
MSEEVEKQEAPEGNDPGLGLGSFLKKETPEAQAPEAVEKATPEAKQDAKVEAKVEKDATPKPDTAAPDFKPNWDDDTNPWKKKASEFDQRFRDTQRSRSQLEAQNREFQRQLTVLQAKFDGTYDPRIHEPPPVDPATYRTLGEIEGKATTSYAAAVEAYGEEKVMRTLERYAELFANDTALQQRVLLSHHPVKAAMDAVEGADFFGKHGNSPSQIMDSLRKQLLEELTPKIREEEAKRLQKELRSTNSEPKGLALVQGTSGATDAKVSKENAGRQKPLGALFGR